MLRRSFALSTVIALVVLGSACASPTLPLTPPEAPTVESGTDADHIKLVAGCGGAESDAVIVIVNENPAVAGDLAVSGALASDCGGWDALVYAHSGDVLSVTQEVGTLGSTPETVQVQ